MLFLVDWVQSHAHEYLTPQQSSEPAQGISNDASSTCSGITYPNYNQRFRDKTMDNEFDDWFLQKWFLRKKKGQ